MRRSGTKPSNETFNSFDKFRAQVMDMVNAIRQNHALEHATIAVLTGKLGASARLGGRATLSGFHIYGDAPTEAVTQAAEEGLARLKRGEHDLAVSPLCGTNLAAGGVLAGLASMIAMKGKNGMRHLPRVLSAALIAVVLAQPLGSLVQKHLTTSTDLATLNIAEVTCRGKGILTRHRVRTVRGS